MDQLKVSMTFSEAASLQDFADAPTAIYEETHFQGTPRWVAYITELLPGLNALLAYLAERKSGRKLERLEIKSGPDRSIVLEGVDLEQAEDIEALAQSLIDKLDGKAS